MIQSPENTRARAIDALHSSKKSLLQALLEARRAGEGETDITRGIEDTIKFVEARIRQLGGAP